MPLHLRKLFSENIRIMNFPWGHDKRYNDYSTYMKSTYGERIQKVSINAGFTCPNRDGTKGYGGCYFCNNSTFNPDYCEPEISITEQIDKGVAVFDKKYKTQKYLAYFQAYSNTYGETKELIRKYEEALNHPKVSGLILGTRPDCLADDLLEILAEWNKTKHITIELGAESTYNHTLESINRGHSWEVTKEAIYRVNALKIPVGVHMIFGLPGESREELLFQAKTLSSLPFQFLKIHQLQIVRGSVYGKRYLDNPSGFKLFEPDEFVELIVDFLERIKPEIVFERFISQAPYSLLIAPKWGLKNFEFVAMVEKRLEQRNTWQGKLYADIPTITN